MKLLILIIILFIKLCTSQNSGSSCTSYINSKSTYNGASCGSSLQEACQTFTLAVQSCNINSFNSTTYYFSPGLYSFENIDPFGSIQNKSITIINSDYSIDSTTSYTSVVFDLNGASNTFFLIQGITTTPITKINVTGITFINGYQDNQASIAVNYGIPCTLSFNQCIFSNVTSKGSFDQNGNPTTFGGAFAWTYNKLVGNSGSTISFSQCTYQNSNTNGILGAFFYVSDQASVILTITQSKFTNLSGNGEGVIIYSTSTNILANQIFIISNSSITNNELSGSAVYVSVSVSVSDVTFSNNSGGGYGFYIANRNIYIFDNCNFTNNVDITSVYVDSCSNGLQFTNCLFKNNKYSKDLSSTGGVSLSSSTAYFQNCIFDSNTGTIGSAIFAIGQDSDPAYAKSISLLNTTFSNNFASTNGTIYSSNIYLSITDSDFIENTAVLGSSIYCDRSTITLVSTNTFTNNTDTTTNQQSLSKDTNGVTCGPNGTNSCSINGNLSDLTICGTNENSNIKKRDYKKEAIIIFVVVIIAIIAAISIIVYIKKRGKNKYRPIAHNY